MSSFPPFYILLKHCGLFVTNWTSRMMFTATGGLSNQLDKLENMDVPIDNYDWSQFNLGLSSNFNDNFQFPLPFCPSQIYLWKGGSKTPCSTPCTLTINCRQINSETLNRQPPPICHANIQSHLHLLNRVTLFKNNSNFKPCHIVLPKTEWDEMV